MLWWNRCSLYDFGYWGGMSRLCLTYKFLTKPHSGEALVSVYCEIQLFIEAPLSSVIIFLNLYWVPYGVGDLITLSWACWTKLIGLTNDSWWRWERPDCIRCLGLVTDQFDWDEYNNLLKSSWYKFFCCNCCGYLVSYWIRIPSCCWILGDCCCYCCYW